VTGGHKKAIFTLAVTRSYRDAENRVNRQKAFVPVVAWRALAAQVETLGKDSALLVEGHLRTWSDPKGKNFRWEVAAAALGHLLGIDPFDQPDVQSAKDRTKAVLSSRSGGKLPYPPCTAAGEGFTLTLSKAAAKALAEPAADGEHALGKFASLLRPGDYIGLLAFMDGSGKYAAPLGRIRDSLGAATKAAVQSGYGPRYLHSTGQLHKGGPDNGVFLILAKEHPGGPLIAGADHSFSELIGAQSLGDFQALDGAGRRA
ncbi:MAG: single-stranded DNA-binding protein, partial [Elusimicrobiota bacterium]